MTGRPNRRKFLGAALTGAGIVGAGTLSVSWLVTGGTTLGSELTSTARLPEPFGQALAIPGVLAPTRSDATTDYYAITQQVADVQILPGYSTRIWGYNGTFPGPTLQSSSARRTVVTHRNHLPVPVVVHLHGGHVPYDSDGFPTDYLLPAQWASAHTSHDAAGQVMRGQRDYDYPVGQPAATLWYHDHRMDFTGASVWKGLAGFHLINDDAERALNLPSGARDIPLMLTDRAFAADGALIYPGIDPSMTSTPGVTAEFTQGVLGDVILVNGVPWPTHRVTTARYRLRWLNASNARVYRLRIESKAAAAEYFTQIGSDGGLLAHPQVLTAIDIAPGERFDTILDFTECALGDLVTIHNDLGTGRTGEIMRFIIADRSADTSHVPDTLADIELHDPKTAVRTRHFDFRRGDMGDMRGWLINGLPFDAQRPAADPRLGDLEIWRFSTDFNHPVHVHLNQFQVLSRNRRPPRPSDAGWKDTVNLAAREVAEVAVKFTDYPGRFVMHCHTLEHEDMAMMATFATR
ncbi:multicopper oxidase family protein [Nocardia sp. NBC_00403]|uniref:multicopper oxidase family protein n=1 Tax=Nocardia sp. NBC_00403 TaxID=2975990 RepID=UPI002E20F40A